MSTQPIPYKDAELVKRASGLRDEQDRWNDLFATKLIEVLDKIDAVRAEVKADSQRNTETAMSAKALDVLVKESHDLSASLYLTDQTHKKYVQDSKIILESAIAAKDILAKASLDLEAARGLASKAVKDLSSAIEVHEKSKQLAESALSDRLEATNKLSTATSRVVSAENKLAIAQSNRVTVRDATRKAFQGLVVCVIAIIVSLVSAGEVAHINWKTLLILCVPLLPVLYAVISMRKVAHEL